MFSEHKSSTRRKILLIFIIYRIERKSKSTLQYGPKATKKDDFLYLSCIPACGVSPICLGRRFLQRQHCPCRPYGTQRVIRMGCSVLQEMVLRHSGMRAVGFASLSIVLTVVPVRRIMCVWNERKIRSAYAEDTSEYKP